MMFPLTCPTCRYDLSATPDGKCPECGGTFTHAELRGRRRWFLCLDPRPELDVARGLALGSAALAAAAIYSSVALHPVRADISPTGATVVGVLLVGAWVATAAWRRVLLGVVNPPIESHLLAYSLLLVVTLVTSTALPGIDAPWLPSGWLFTTLMAALHAALVRSGRPDRIAWRVIWVVPIAVGPPCSGTHPPPGPRANSGHAGTA